MFIVGVSRTEVTITVTRIDRASPPSTIISIQTNTNINNISVTLSQANHGEWGRSASYVVDSIYLGMEFGRMDRSGQPYNGNNSFGFANPIDSLAFLSPKWPFPTAPKLCISSK